MLSFISFNIDTLVVVVKTDIIVYFSNFMFLTTNQKFAKREKTDIIVYFSNFMF